MKENEFYNVLQNALQEKLGKDWNVKVDTNVEKDNGACYVGMSIGKVGERIAPQIYIRRYWQSFRDGATIDEIIKSVIGDYENAMLDFDADQISFLYDWQEAKRHLSVKLLSKKMNEHRLKDIVYEDFCDLVAIAMLHVDYRKNSIKSIRVTNDMLDRWGVTKEEVMILARKNAEQHLPAQMNRLCDYIEHLLDNDEQTYLSEASKRLQVLTNEMAIHGAVVMLYDSFMKSVYERIGEFYILPSSIHEVIVTPVDRETPLWMWQKLVQDVNSRFVRTEEVLSNSIYVYDGERVCLVCDENGECYE